MPLDAPAAAASGPVVNAPPVARQDDVLTPEAMAFVAELHRRFDGRRRALLADRVTRQARFDAGAAPDFSPETAKIRAGD